MILTERFRKDWIFFMSNYVDGVYDITIYTPESLKNDTMFLKMKPKIKVKVNIVEKLTRSVKVEYTVLDKDFQDIIYLPTSKSLQTIISDTNKKISDKINEYLIENNINFILDEYENLRNDFLSSIKIMINK